MMKHRVEPFFHECIGQSQILGIGPGNWYTWNKNYQTAKCPNRYRPHFNVQDFPYTGLAHRTISLSAKFYT